MNFTFERSFKIEVHAKVSLISMFSLFQIFNYDSIVHSYFTIFQLQAK